MTYNEMNLSNFTIKKITTGNLNTLDSDINPQKYSTGSHDNHYMFDKKKP